MTHTLLPEQQQLPPQVGCPPNAAGLITAMGMQVKDESVDWVAQLAQLVGIVGLPTVLADTHN